MEWRKIPYGCNTPNFRISILTLFLGMTGSMAAYSNQDSNSVNVSIPSGGLGEALSQYAAAANVAISFDSAKTAGMHTNGLRGEYTVDGGFDSLLRGTGLKWVKLAEKRYTLLADPTAEPVEREKIASLGETTILASAEQELKQTPGVSIITAEDIARNPPTNDLSEIIRKMPGVNLTGNSSTGQRGNNRQIDIRGMGPENTLILIDGKPVTSRNAVRYGWGGERDSRGDSNWVPADQVEKIEVIRGPAASRYGSGSMGGVVNIITKAPTNELHGNATIYSNLPENKKEGATKRITFGASGPVSDTVAFRVYGNLNKTENDSATINADHGSASYAGREGVRNQDINGLLSWQIDPRQSLDLEAGFSRQGNLYAGDTQLSNKPITSRDVIKNLVGHETNRLYRDSFSATHRGNWDWGDSLSYVQYEHTKNSRLLEGAVGSQEGMILGSDFGESDLTNIIAHTEATIPLYTPLNQALTIGGEWTQQKLNDPVSTAQTLAGGDIPGYTTGTRNPRSESIIQSILIEDNIYVSDETTITPGLRLDHHNKFGANWSPSLNISHYLGNDFTFKAGIARAFKAPNLYQINPNYLLYSSGNGCLAGATNSCYLLGNSNLEPEVSINKELGIEFRRDGWVAGLTYFRNDYKNKIVAGTDVVGQAAGGLYSGTDILQWENAKKAVVEGIEGTLRVPIQDRLSWTTNITGMLQAVNKDTGNPLSTIPRFTINTALDWDITDRIAMQVSYSQFGPQKAATHATNRLQARSGVDTREVGTYGIASFSGKYRLTDNVSVSTGVSNLFDKRLYRGTENRTYNEAGRTLYTSLTVSF